MKILVLAILAGIAVNAYGQDADDMENSNLPNPTPRADTPSKPTLSQRYPNDRFELCTECLYVEQYNRPDQTPDDPDDINSIAPIDWYKRTNFHRFGHPYRWKIKTGNVPFPPDWTQEDWDPVRAVQGGSWRVRMWDKTYGTAAPTFKPVGEKDHLFYRYYVWFDPQVSFATRCDGGKLPGVANPFPNGNSGDGRLVRGGHNGWSLRGGYGINCVGETGHPKVAVNTYAYHGDMTGEYGDHWRWGLVDTGKWYCLEGEVLVNTPGIRDGILRGWIDGQLMIERLNLFLRAPPYSTNHPSGTTTYGIRQFWGTLHHGGKYGMFYGAPGKTADILVDQVVVATERIGCLIDDDPLPPQCPACLKYDPHPYPNPEIEGLPPEPNGGE